MEAAVKGITAEQIIKYYPPKNRESIMVSLTTLICCILRCHPRINKRHQFLLSHYNQLISQIRIYHQHLPHCYFHRALGTHQASAYRYPPLISHCAALSEIGAGPFFVVGPSRRTGLLTVCTRFSGSHIALSEGPLARFRGDSCSPHKVPHSPHPRLSMINNKWSFQKPANPWAPGEPCN